MKNKKTFDVYFYCRGKHWIEAVSKEVLTCEKIKCHDELEDTFSLGTTIDSCDIAHFLWNNFERYDTMRQAKVTIEFSDVKK